LHAFWVAVAKCENSRRITTADPSEMMSTEKREESDLSPLFPFSFFSSSPPFSPLSGRSKLLPLW